MESQTILVDLSEDVRQVLTENEVDLITELQRQGLDVERGFRPEHLRDVARGAKSPELIVLASAAAAPLVANGIAKIIDAVSRSRRAKVTTRDASATETQSTASSTHSTKVSLLGLKVELNDTYK